MKVENGRVITTSVSEDNFGNKLTDTKVTDTQGNFVSHTAEGYTGSANINGDTVSFMKKENLNTGELIEHTATGKTNSARPVEGKDKAKYNVEKGAEVAYTLDSSGSVVKTEYGKAVTADGKTGSLTLDSSGKSVFATFDKGHKVNESAIDDTNISKMHRSHWGSDNRFGDTFNFSDELTHAVVDNNWQTVHKVGKQYLQSNTPNAGGRALVKQIVGEVEKFGNISQSLQDGLATGYKAGLSANIGIDASANIAGGRQAVESISSNAISLALQNYAEKVMKADKSAEWKAQKITEMANKAYELIDAHGIASTLGQLD